MYGFMEYKWAFVSYGIAAFFCFVLVAVVLHYQKVWLAITSIVMLIAFLCGGILIAAFTTENINKEHGVESPKDPIKVDEGETTEESDEQEIKIPKDGQLKLKIHW